MFGGDVAALKLNIDFSDKGATPHNASVRFGDLHLFALTLTGLNGRVFARTTNGQVKGDTLGGAIDARTTNGGVNMDLSSIGREPVSLHTTNGGVRGTASWESGRSMLRLNVATKPSTVSVSHPTKRRS